jgi:hypothetical protein
VLTKCKLITRNIIKKYKNNIKEEKVKRGETRKKDEGREK